MSHLETAVLATAPDEAPDVAGMLLDAPPVAELRAAPDQEATGAAPELGDGAELPADLISPEAFGEQWGLLHDMLGGMVQMRSGAPCPLGAQARNEGGMVACRATYALLASNPTLARMFLTESSTFLGQALAIGLHGFACVQIVKASRAAGAQIEPEAQAAA